MSLKIFRKQLSKSFIFPDVVQSQFYFDLREGKDEKRVVKFCEIMITPIQRFDDFHKSIRILHEAAKFKQ